MTTYTVAVGQNINDIAKQAAPGDVIELAPGTHTLAPVILSPSRGHKHGTASNPITIRSQNPNSRATISYNWGGVKSARTCQFVLEDLDYWIADNIRVANFQNQGVVLHALTRDSTGCVIKNFLIEDQQHVPGQSAYVGVGAHAVLVNGTFTKGSFDSTSTNDAAPTVRNAHFYRNVLKKTVSGTYRSYNENFTVAGRVDGCLVEECDIIEAGFGIAFNCLGAGHYPRTTPAWQNYTWYPAQPTNITFRRNRVINLRQSAYAGTAFYSDRAGDNCTWEYNFASGVKSLIAISHEVGSHSGTVQGSGHTVRYNVGVCSWDGTYGSSSALGILLGTNNNGVPSIGSIDCYGNNLIIRNVGTTQWGSGGIQMYRVDRANVYDNLVYEESNGQSFAYLSHRATTVDGSPLQINTSGWKIYNNRYWSDVGTNHGQWSLPGTSVYNNLTSWQTTGWDAGSRMFRPIFVNPNGNKWEDFQFINDDGAYSLSASFVQTQSGLAVEFVDTSISSAPIDVWLWTFGDGNTSDAQNPSHTYAADGDYTVQLTVTNSVGNDTASRVLSVSGEEDSNKLQTLPVTAGGDDVYGNLAGWYKTAEDYCTVGDQAEADANYDFKAGMRFALAQPIPAGARIKKATIRLRASWAGGKAYPTIRLRVEATSNAKAWTDHSDFYSRALTTAYTDWNLTEWSIGAYYESPDFSAAIQELVDTYGGLAGGAYIAVSLADAESGFNGDRRVAFSSFDSASSNAPVLTFEWEEGSGGVWLIRQLRQSVNASLRVGFAG